jgi:hypothetical protein
VYDFKLISEEKSSNINMGDRVKNGTLGNRIKKWVYSYNESGKLIEKILYEKNFPKPKLILKYKYYTQLKNRMSPQ